ncbi:MAG: hypothetical protein ACFE9Z_16840 [Promethearchaeota archaeon]
MKICLECGKEIDDEHTICEICAYVRLEKYVNELYKKQEKTTTCKL